MWTISSVTYMSRWKHCTLVFCPLVSRSAPCTPGHFALRASGNQCSLAQSRTGRCNRLSSIPEISSHDDLRTAKIKLRSVANDRHQHGSEFSQSSVSANGQKVCFFSFSFPFFFFFFFFLFFFFNRPGRRFAEKIWSVVGDTVVKADPEKVKGETRRSCKLARKRRKCSNISTCRLLLGALLLMLSASRFLTAGSPLLVPAPYLFSVHQHGMTFLSSLDSSFYKTADLPCFLFRAAVFIHLKCLLAAVFSCEILF